MSKPSSSKTDKTTNIDFEDIHEVEKQKLRIDKTENSMGLTGWLPALEVSKPADISDIHPYLKGSLYNYGENYHL